MTQRIPGPDLSARALARQLVDMQRRLRELESASQAGLTSVEGRTLDFYDPDTDELLGTIGLQKDGTFGFNRTGGAKPEAPTEPDVQPIPGGAIVAWDGRFEDAQSMLQIDRIAVHMDETAGFTVTRDTEVAAIYSHSGGTAVIPIDDGTEWYVKLVAVTKGQAWSDPSTEVHVAAVDANVAFYREVFTLTAAGAQDLTLTFTPISFSEDVDWHPSGGAGLDQREDVDWTRIERTLSLLSSDYAMGDVIAIEYAYVEADSDALVAFQSAGWKYLPVAATDTTNRSATGFDDSTWATGSAAFGTFVGGISGWPAPTTPWTPDTSLWLRRTITSRANAAITIDARVEDSATFYWNGTQIGTAPGPDAGEVILTIPASSVTGSDVLAIRVDDEVAVDNDQTYIDAEVTQ